ncbi:MAG: NAD(P)H-hydrate dehydratase [Sphaerochaetaceae bacterium]|nr:NAD(P)H-hydrate dehydratase [Sphaerochaetaceae bacterium]
MQKVFEEVNSLDKKCYENFFMSEDLLMEHAANSMANFIKQKFEKNTNILIVCGTGNNGADGIALARILYKDYHVSVFLPFGTKSNMGRLQLKRAGLVGVEIIEDKSHKLPLKSYDVVVDALFGTGLKRPLQEECIQIIQVLNKLEAYKIACDIPSGIIDPSALQITNYAAIFDADTTITMGALKYQLFGDLVKSFVGEIIVADLGLSRKLYEDEKCSFYLLEKKDMRLPLRTNKPSHKGNYGHLAVIAGEKIGAATLCAEAGFVFGAGLVTAVSNDNYLYPYHIMQNKSLPNNTSAIALGMGLGKIDEEFLDEVLNNELPKVIDADLFYNEYILKVLQKENLVLTPHPKEFCSLLEICEIAQIDVATLQNNRFKFVQKFNEKYPNIVLLLKGANTLISYKGKTYINPFGTSVLSQGGSGDVLCGLIASLLAQNYDILDAAVSASLAMTFAAQNYTKNNYSMKPQDLIEEVKKL